MANTSNAKDFKSSLSEGNFRIASFIQVLDLINVFCVYASPSNLCVTLRLLTIKPVVFEGAHSFNQIKFTCAASPRLTFSR